MNAKYQSIYSFLFNIRILNKDKKYKKIKEIFIRKQDIYLIKLLEKRAKNNQNAKLDLKKIKKEDNYKIYNPPKENKFSDYKNIRIIKKKLDINNNNNSILESILDEPKNNFNLITSKIYNSDSSRNNKTMLNINAENKNENILRAIYENNNKKDNLLKTKFNRTSLDLINQKQNYKTPNMKNKILPKNIKINYKKYFNGTTYDSRKSLLDNNLNINSEQSININNKKNPIYKNIINKINLIDKNDPIINSKDKNLSKSNNKKIEFHNLFNLFKKDKKNDDIRKKISNLNKIKLRNINLSRKNNIFKVNHSVNKTGKTRYLDNLFNNNIDKLPLVIKN